MGIPEVPDQVKRAPTLALRALFAGVGRLLLAAENSTARPATPDQGDGVKPKSAIRNRQSEEDEPGRAASRWRSLDRTGNVRLLSPLDLDDYDALSRTRGAAAGHVTPTDTEGLAADRDSTSAGAVATADAAAPAPEAIPAPETAPGTETAPADAAVPATAAGPVQGTAEPATPDAAPQASEADSLPMPRYDELSLASIRARLRTLDTSQLRVLADYERKNAGRPDVLGMLERRIEKLEAGG